MTKAELGGKRRCLSCNTAFFDLNRTPIVCPKCAEVFHVVETVRSSRARGVPFVSGGRLPPHEASANEIILEGDDECVGERMAPARRDDERPEVDSIEEIA